MLDRCETWLELLHKSKQINKINTIYLWHEETLAKMKAKFIDLNVPEN